MVKYTHETIKLKKIVWRQICQRPHHISLRSISHLDFERHVNAERNSKAHGAKQRQEGMEMLQNMWLGRSRHLGMRLQCSRWALVEKYSCARRGVPGNRDGLEDLRGLSELKIERVKESEKWLILIPAS